MKPLTKKILILSTCLMGAGVLLTCAGIAAGGWPGFKITRNGLRSSATQRQPYILEKTQIGSFSSLDINIGSEADIILEPSDDDHFYLEYTLDGDYNEPSCKISNGTLHFTHGDTGAVVNGVYFFGPGTDSENITPEIRLYIPEGLKLSDLTVYNDYGNLSIQQIKAEHADINLDYGDMDLTDSTFASADIDISAGDFEADASSVDELSFINEYGDSEFNSMTVKTADLTIECGDLLLEAAGFETLTGVNEYGDTSLLLHGPLNEYTLNLSTEYGVITIPDNAPGKLDATDIAEMSYTSQADGNKMIEFTAESGDIEMKSD